MVHEAVARGCKEQQRQIEMKLMFGNIPHLLELLWSWIAPSEDDQNFFRPHGDPQMIRFGAHLVLALRYLLTDEMKNPIREEHMIVGDHIIHMYAMFLFSKQHEELVGIYASQLACHCCIDFFVHMMELRLNRSVHVKYKIFFSVMEYLPFSPGDDSKGSFEEIIENVLSRSREIKLGKYDKVTDVAEQHGLQSSKGYGNSGPMFVVLMFNNLETLSGCNRFIKMASISNILFREFALISVLRVLAMPIGAYALLSFLAEPLKQLSETPDTLKDYVSENLKEFQDWLKIELENADVPELSFEEKQRAVAAAQETMNLSLVLLQPILCLPTGECMCPDATICAAVMSALYSTVNVSVSSSNNYCIEVVLRCLAVEGDGLASHDLNDGGSLGTVMADGFKGELVRFQPGVTMEICRLDAWYSSEDGSLEGPATYIIRGLCRRFLFHLWSRVMNLKAMRS
ncbi:hypothetical protein Pint_29198 [Pistacia integerrima]|uniref:Uncharacterized protein n=1 Tax=Pistacia integerrima TaxID=434235 RepID=A0ACC0X3E3_9ROSI|nr:hypothetical protein Pint_29198 [Pistacia integerrima]